MNKYCRICWNSKYWHEPTGEAAELEKGQAYVRQAGYGQEEWLFNFSWLQPGPKTESGLFRYGFLQPIGKYLPKYQGQTFDVFLYTVTRDRRRLAIAIIRELYVPMDDELKTAHQYMRKRGWLREMENDLSTLGIGPKPLKGSPDTILNIRFRQSKVEFFEPRFILPANHVTARIDRYQPLNWTDAAPRLSTTRRLPGNGKRKSESQRTKAAIESTIYSPRHNKLQNALDTFLRRVYGDNSVRYESEFVDIQLHHNNEITYFEIKMAPTAKSCMREALGQLLEYSVYPNKQRASKMVVVGENPATPDDLSYVAFLKSEFKIPVRYIRWNWEKNALDESL